MGRDQAVSASETTVTTELITRPFNAEAEIDRNKNKSLRMKEEALEAKRIVDEKGHILLLTCQELWQEVIAFIRPLRAHYLPHFTPIVVMSPAFPGSELWDKFDDVSFVVGDPNKHDDLSKFGAAVADKVVLLAGPPDCGIEERLADSNAMIANSILESIYLENDVDHFAIFEYAHPENAQILPMTPLCSLLENEEPHTGSDESSISSPRFASGRIFVPSLFGSLFANSYTTPGIMELMEALVMPGRRNQKTFPFQLPALERVATEWIGRTYSDLCMQMLDNGLGVDVGVETLPDGTEQPKYTHCLPLGVYRKTVETLAEEGSLKVTETPKPLGKAHQGMRFVYANPDPGWGEVLLPGDQIYVLAPEEWGRRVSLRAEVESERPHLLSMLLLAKRWIALQQAELDNSDRNIFLDGCQPRDDTAPPRSTWDLMQPLSISAAPEKNLNKTKDSGGWGCSVGHEYA